jgi:hypothetical protein
MAVALRFRRHRSGFRVGSRLQHFRASRALGILQLAVLGDDERAAQRNHHQDAQQPTEQSHERHAGDFQIKTKNQDRWHRDADAEGDGFARRAGGLDDVVFEDRGVPRAQP